MTTIIHGDCIEVMATMDAASVDAIVCDPPYELGFMGKRWDGTGIAFDPATWEACLRVLKPGGHLLAFGGSRTFHRIAVAIEDAGFEIRDTLSWLYGSGFPKSLDVGKAITAHQTTGSSSRIANRRAMTGDDTRSSSFGSVGSERSMLTSRTTPPPRRNLTPEAEQWQGWGTALKPAWEPVIMARKPLVGTVAQNVAAYGTGAINVDATRIAANGEQPRGSGNAQRGTVAHGDRNALFGGSITPESGRWPANLLLDEDAAALLDAMSGERGGGYGVRGKSPNGRTYAGGKGFANTLAETGQVVGYGDSGGASRFFFVAPSDDICLICNGTYTPKTGTMNATKGDVPCKSVNTAISHSSRTEAVSDSVADPVPGLLALDFEGRPDSLSTPALIAGSSSLSTQEITASTALPNAADSQRELLAQRVKSAGSLCDSCATATAQSLVAMLHGQIPVSPLGQDSTPNCNASILNRNLAAFAEPLVNTGIIPTTASLSILFGSVRHAISENITTASADTFAGSDLTRLKYCPKASRAERNAGLDGMPERSTREGAKNCTPRSLQIFEQSGKLGAPRQNFHPTVKPLSLMRWLVRLVTPPGGTVMDPFAGSGTTGCAAVLEGVGFIGIEQDAEYVEIARKRIAHWTPTPEPQLALDLGATTQ